MAELSDLEARLAALEARVEVVAADAAAARHLAAARDRDLADIGVKVDANRSVINALGEQTAARFTRVEQQIDGVRTEMRNGFAEVRGRLDQAAAGQEQIVALLNTLIEQAAGSPDAFAYPTRTWRRRHHTSGGTGELRIRSNCGAVGVGSAAASISVATAGAAAASG